MATRLSNASQRLLFLALAVMLTAAAVVVAQSAFPQQARATFSDPEYIDEVSTLAGGAQGGVVAECPTGKKVVGGGAYSGDVALQILGSTPYGVNVTGDSWAAYFKNTSVTSKSIQAWAVCATIS